MAGTRQVVTITFDTILAPLAFSTPVTFGDVPIVREVISTNADPLFATYAGGAVTFATGLESDVTPRFDGDDILPSPITRKPVFLRLDLTRLTHRLTSFSAPIQPPLKQGETVF